MSIPRVDLVLIWHFHQPDYRSPRSHKAELPWVRLHATKDYLDMIRHAAAHPGVRVTFNFVPTLLDQLEDAARGSADALFERMARPPGELSAEERTALAHDLVRAPRHAVERWPLYRKGIVKVAGEKPAIGEQDLLDLEVWFLLAWLDPTLHAEPAAAEALERASSFLPAHRDRLLELHARLAAQVLPECRALAERGQIEVSTTPYYHPILPILIQIDAAHRARPDLVLPEERWAAPEDAALQLERAMARHAALFGSPPAGCWPAEGGVSPEAAELAAAAGLRWIASDEGVLWASLAGSGRRREMLYQPWTFTTPRGEIGLLFRDHELSDRIGFVYQRWEAAPAAEDFVERVLKIGREYPGERPPLVTVILDGENCWEGYGDDGAEFLDSLYGRLEAQSEIRTRTASEVFSEGHAARLPGLHSGSWIDADFHIWVGHAEKNRAWDLLGRARRALVARGATSESHPAAWESLFRAEGSDWFWWYGDDHPSLDRDRFDRLFREHLQAVYRWAEIETPAILELPIGGRRDPAAHRQPVGLVHPILDGRRSHFYEWSDAGRFHLGASGTSMHRAAGLGRDLYYGFDLERFYLRVDFRAQEPPGAAFWLRLDFAEPRPARLEVDGLIRGARPVVLTNTEEGARPIAGAECRIASVLELAVPFAALALRAGDAVELVAQVVRDGRPVEGLPPDDWIRFRVPDEGFEATMWSA